MLTRVLISLPLVKVFFISVFNILVSLHSYLYLHAILHMYVDLGKHILTVMALVGFSASAV